MINLCRRSCCPQLSFSDDRKTAMISADREEDDVFVDGSMVGIRFTSHQLQVLADELLANGVVAVEKPCVEG